MDWQADLGVNEKGVIMTHNIIQGDCIEGMRQLPDESVHCVVTSPPYYGLRDYGTATWEGGDVNCDHVEVSVGMSSKNTLGPTKHLPDTNAANVSRIMQYKDICGKCGATRVDRQIGLEETPEAYVERLVDVFREVRRILRSDGTVWLNLGDSYWGGKGQNGTSKALSNAEDRGYQQSRGTMISSIRPQDRNHLILKPKDIIGIPWRVAFALQADGWWLRQDIIWHKPNPMPESVTDRCTKSHEYIFLLTKSERYYYDAEAIKEESKTPWNSAKGFSAGGMRANLGVGTAAGEQWNGTKTHQDKEQNGRNKRSVWTVLTKPYKGAHFAVYPPKLIEPCILAGSPVGGTVFDPFTGSGTTAAVAIAHGRNFIGTELNPDYIALAEQRLAAVQRTLI